MEQPVNNAPARTDYRARRRPRWGALVLVVAGHLLIGAVLIRAFAPQFPAQAIEAVGSLVTVTITAPPEPPPSNEPDPGAAGEEGRKATPREAQAPAARIPVRPTPVPLVSSTGSANASGAREPGREDVHDVAYRHQHEHRGERELDGLGDHARCFPLAARQCKRGQKKNRCCQ